MFDRTYVAMDITNSDVRVVAVKRNKVRKWTSVSIPEGAVKNGMILEPDTISLVIENIFSSLKLNRNRVICTVTGLPFIYRVIKMPRGAPGVLDEAIERAARQEMSLTHEDMLLFWQSTKANPDQNEIDYLVVGVPNTSLSPLLETLTKAGVKPYIMEIKPLALARAASVEKALLVSLEKGFYDIVLVSGGLVRVMHSVSATGKQTDTVNVVNELVDGLNKATKSFNRDFPGNALEPDTPVLLCGELSLNSQILSLTQEATGYPVSIIKPVLDCPPDMKVELFASATGLASRTQKGKTDTSGYNDVEINLLRKEKKPSQLRYQMAYAGFGLVIILLGALVYETYNFKGDALIRTDSLQKEAVRVTQLLANTQKTNTQVLADKKAASDKLQSLVEQKNAIAAEHQKIIDKKHDYSSRIALITAALPEGAYFERIDMQPDGITVTGQVADPFDVLNFTEAVERTGAFSGVMAETIAPLEETGGATFEVHITE